MGMTHAQAVRIVQAWQLIGPAHGTVHGDFDRVQAALDQEPRMAAALNALDPSRIEETPQGAAAHLGCREILEYMLAKGVKRDIFMVCALGRTEDVAALLRHDPALANALGAHGIHVLNHAADRPTAQLLLDHGADPNTAIYPAWDWTPLHEAAAKGRLSILEVLIAAHPLSFDTDGTTPLHAAARNGHRAVAEWLLTQGAVADARGHGGPWEGKTPLEIAVEYGHAEIAELLGLHDSCDTPSPGAYAAITGRRGACRAWAPAF